MQGHRDLFLVVDAGNSRIKLGLATSGLQISFLEGVAHNRNATAVGLAEEIAARLKGAGVDAKGIDAAFVSSPAQTIEPALKQALWALGFHKVKFVPRDVPVPLKNRYKNPEALGADRLLGAYAAVKLFGVSSAVVVDCGTATTFNCVQDGVFLGGLICPGLETSAKALAGSAAGLFVPDLRRCADLSPIARDTDQALRSGFLLGFAGMIEGVLADIKPLMPPDVVVIGAGGLASTLESVRPLFDKSVKGLVLHGLALVAESSFV